MKAGWWLLLVTSLLTLGGCFLYAFDHVGWAQMLWVMASGTAGGSVAMFIDGDVHYHHGELHHHEDDENESS